MFKQTVTSHTGENESVACMPQDEWILSCALYCNPHTYDSVTEPLICRDTAASMSALITLAVKPWTVYKRWVYVGTHCFWNLYFQVPTLPFWMMPCNISGFLEPLSNSLWNEANAEYTKTAFHLMATWCWLQKQVKPQGLPHWNAQLDSIKSHVHGLVQEKNGLNLYA